MSTAAFVQTYLRQTAAIAQAIDPAAIEAIVEGCVRVREGGGRLFFLGVGGSAANASHAVNDFRKLCGIECYAATDNVSELTARINDEGWEGVFAAWLRTSRLGKADGVFVLSVGGGSVERAVSANIVAALRYAKEIGATICGVVGRDGGYTRQVADACCVVPIVDATAITPHTESFQSIVCHCIVSHPRLARGLAKWESL